MLQVHTPAQPVPPVVGAVPAEQQHVLAADDHHAVWLVLDPVDNGVVERAVQQPVALPVRAVVAHSCGPQFTVVLRGSALRVLF